MSGPAVPDAIAPISLIFKLNNGLVSRTLDGLTDDEVWRALPAGGNPIGWLLGHLTETRASLLHALGSPLETGWPASFARGASLADRSVYPTRPMIEQAWKATHGRMRDAFAALTNVQLASPSTVDLPGATNLAGQIAFLAFHESYHVGQMGYVRKQLGHSAIAG